MKRNLLIIIPVAFLLAIVTLQISAQPNTTFTLEELAKYNGQNGAKAYIALNGKVYDISSAGWFGGLHFGHAAGSDISTRWAEVPVSHQQPEFLARYPVMGRLAPNSKALKILPGRGETSAFWFDRQQLHLLGWAALVLGLISLAFLPFRAIMRQNAKRQEVTKNKYLNIIARWILRRHNYLGLATLILVGFHMGHRIGTLRLTPGLGAVLSLILVCLSGIAIQVWPKPIGLMRFSRKLHLVLASVFAVALIWHLLLNWV